MVRGLNNYPILFEKRDEGKNCWKNTSRVHGKLNVLSIESTLSKKMAKGTDFYLDSKWTSKKNVEITTQNSELTNTKFWIHELYCVIVKSFWQNRLNTWITLQKQKLKPFFLDWHPSLLNSWQTSQVTCQLTLQMKNFE